MFKQDELAAHRLDFSTTLCFARNDNEMDLCNPGTPGEKSVILKKSGRISPRSDIRVSVLHGLLLKCKIAGASKGGMNMFSPSPP